MDEMTGWFEEALESHRGVLMKFEHMTENERKTLLERARIVKSKWKR